MTMLMGIRGLLDCMLACSCVVVEQSRNEGTAAVIFYSCFGSVHISFGSLVQDTPAPRQHPGDGPSGSDDGAIAAPDPRS